MLTPQAIDLLIEARWIIPVRPFDEVLENYAVAVDHGRIVAILQQSEAAIRYRPRQRKCLTEHLLIPGLVNLHTHAAMSLLRGQADDLPLMQWLHNYIWPAEATHVSKDFVYDGTLLACAEMLKGGITCFNDMYFFPEAAAKAALRMGMRAALGLLVLDFPTNYAADCEDYLAKGMACRDAYKHESLLSFCLAPHAPYTVSDKSFRKTHTLAEQCALPIHVHLHETAQEIHDSLRTTHMRPLERMQQLGLLSPDLIAVHGVHLNAQDIRLLAEYGCSVAHCPVSNLKLASGIAPIAQLRAAGINIGLGTDGAASNNRLDILREMQLALLLAKGSSGDAKALNAHQALRMATLNGAQALGLDKEIGSIEPGKSADLCALHMHDISLLPGYNPLSTLAYAIGREQVSDVWVAGKCCITDKQLSVIVETELISSAALWQNRLRSQDV